MSFGIENQEEYLKKENDKMDRATYMGFYI